MDAALKTRHVGRFAAVIALAFLTPSFSGAQPEEPAFRVWFERQLAVLTALPAEARNVATRYRYVFVAGFLNEAFRVGYFNENRQALIDEGVKDADIHIIFPNSGGTVEENVAFLRQTIPDLAARDPLTASLDKVTQVRRRSRRATSRSK